MNTHSGILCLAVMLMTANWVLSPSSATKSKAKVLSKTRTSSGIGGSSVQKIVAVARPNARTVPLSVTAKRGRARCSMD